MGTALPEACSSAAFAFLMRQDKVTVSPVMISWRSAVKTSMMGIGASGAAGREVAVALHVAVKVGNAVAAGTGEGVDVAGEGVGSNVAVGILVTGVKVGDIVGVGVLVATATFNAGSGVLVSIKTGVAVAVWVGGAQTWAKVIGGGALSSAPLPHTQASSEPGATALFEAPNWE